MMTPRRTSALRPIGYPFPHSPLWRRGILPAIDLFAGCGGTSIGLQKSGFDVRAAVEISRAAAHNYALNVGLKPLVVDIRRVRGKDLLTRASLRRGECFLLAACPPCQGFSSQRKPSEGVQDRRNSLIFRVVHLMREIQPAYLLLENVPGLAAGVGRTLFNRACADLGRLGYRMRFKVLDAADFGVPQRRARLILVAWHHTMPPVDLPDPTHCKPAALSFLINGPSSPWKTVYDAIGPSSDLAPLTAGEADPHDPLHAAPAHNELILRRIMAIPLDGGSRADLPSDLVLDCHRDRKHNGHRDVYGRMEWERPSPTLTGGCNKPSKGRFIHPEQHRAVTLREAALLQTFPIGARFEGARQEIADQIGNAVPPDFVVALARPLKEAAGEWLACDRSSDRRRQHLSPSRVRPRLISPVLTGRSTDATIAAR